jgi:hypothetical protein
VRYVKTVNSLAQIATTKAVSGGAAVSASYREKVAVFFGPYVAYDGLAATAAGTSFSYINVPSHTVRLRWYGQYCPWLLIEYYVNGIAYTTRFVGPSTSSPINYYCSYDVPSTVLQLRARDYVISKALSKGGGITVSVVYWVGYMDVLISFNGNLEIVYDRWIEPFHSKYMYADYPYLEWGEMLLLNTLQALSTINSSKPLNLVTEIRASRNQLVLSLAHNMVDRMWHICGAEWTITVPVSGPRLYYGNEEVEEKWWAAMGKRVLDAVDWFLALGDRKGVVSPILIKVVYNIFQTASGSASVTSSNGLYIVRWIKGWAESPPSTVVIELRRETSSTPQYAEWKYFAVGYYNALVDPVNCRFTLPGNVGTNMYLSPAGARPWAVAKIWTWRGQTFVSTDALDVGRR